ncbi:MAG: DUF5596 domain-containing protein [Clostridia bacterium]|nr:DUF5596 domain-containing protein [Clostridia bacterium]MBQ9774353.1 DUF5596 domain-containing protein [Clostridia bacterium]
MRGWLESFFAEFDFAARDCRDLLVAYDAVVKDPASAAEWQDMMERYDRDLHCDFGELRARAAALAPRVCMHAYTMKLLLFVCLARRARDYYREAGLADALWHDTMMDLKYKMEECREVYGICGSFTQTWFDGFFELKRFALGRLQFEVINFGHTYEKNGKRLMPDSRVINVHIARTGTPLDEKSCDEAFARAASFFAKDLGDTPVAFVCHSWLLYPEHESMLPAHSNVLGFQRRFTLVENGVYGDDHPELWRLFDRPFTGDFDVLPYDSSLRRAYVDHLKAGGKTGWGFGVFFYGGCL